jgi:hypothetical protein
MKTSTNARTRQEHGLARFRYTAIAAAILLVLAGVLAIGGSAGAASGPFTIDGTVPDNQATELPDDSGNVKELGPKNSNDTKIGVIHTAASPMLAMTNPNGQVDLRRAWIKTGKGTESPTAHDWLYFAWERDANSGSGFIAFEFMQSAAPTQCAYETATDAQLIAGCNPWKNRQAGDFMILWDQSGGSTALSLRTWSGSGANLTLGAPVGLNASVSEAKYSGDGFRGEAAVDLTATIFLNTSDCTTFANVIPSTVTGNSDQADYKDTIFTTAPAFSNCGGVTITKKDDDSPQSNLAGAGFTLYTDVHPADAATGHIAEDTATTFTCTTAANGTCSIVGVPIGDYWVVETTTPAGHTAAADQKLHVTAGSSAQLTFVDPREFKVITIVCKNSDNSLYPSEVTLQGGPGSPKTSIGSGDVGAAAAAQLCGTANLGGATFSPKAFGTYTGSVNIPQ